MARKIGRRAVIGLPLAALATGTLSGRSLIRARDLPPAESSEIVERPAEFAHGEAAGARVTGAGIVASGAHGRFVSQVIALPRPVTHIGVHWHLGERAAPSPAVWFQSLAGGGEWTEWRRVHIETPPGATASDDYFGALMDARGALAVRYRLDFPTGGEGRVERVSLALIDTGPLVANQALQDPITPRPSPSPTPSPTPSASLSPTVTVPPTPRGSKHLVLPGLAADWPVPPTSAPYDEESTLALGVVSREGWGADEGLRYKDGKEIWHPMFVPIRLIAVHHTASRNEYGPGESVNDVQAIYNYHAVGHGWGDIGYTALIDKYGVIYEGRRGRSGVEGDQLRVREVLSEGISAGHAKYHNYGSAGVALIGNSLGAGWDMYEPAGPRWEALVSYCAFEARRGFVRPLSPDGSTARNAFLRSDNIWQFDAPSLGGHIDFEQTDCPGDPVIALLPTLRQAVHDRLAGTSRTGVRVTGVTPDAWEIARGTAVSVTWEPEPPEPGWEVVGYEYRFESWFKPMEQDDIAYFAGYTDEPEPHGLWRSAPAAQRQAHFVAKDAGQLTFEVRAVVRSGARIERAAYAGLRSWLVV